MFRNSWHASRQSSNFFRTNGGWLMGFTTAYQNSVVVSTSQTLGRDNRVVRVVGGTDGIVITLYPASPWDTLSVSFIRVDDGAGPVQIVGDGVDYTLTQLNQTVVMGWDGHLWYALANN